MNNERFAEAIRRAYEFEKREEMRGPSLLSPFQMKAGAVLFTLVIVASLFAIRLIDTDRAVTAEGGSLYRQDIHE